MIHINLENRAYLLFGWLIVVMTLLLTPLPPSQGPELTTVSDKIVHALIFGILAFLLYFFLLGINNRSFLNFKNRKTKERVDKLICRGERFGPITIFVLPLLFSSGYSFVLEYAQSFIPGRSANEADFLASLVGIVLTLLFMYGDSKS